MCVCVSEVSTFFSVLSIPDIGPANQTIAVSSLDRLSDNKKGVP